MVTTDRPEQGQTGFARKRLIQGLRGLAPREAVVADQQALTSLTPELRSTFSGLSQFDQAHLLRVWKWLVDNGVTDSDLLAAGLLHDLGKTDGKNRVRLHHRVAKVLLRRFAPSMLVRLTQGYPNAHANGLALAVRHPEIGARRVAALGCSPRTCWLIRYHEAATDLGDDDLRLLQRADFAS